MTLRVAVIKETSGAPRGSGVYTAFVQTLEELSQHPDISLTINRIDGSVDVIHAHTTMWRYLLASFRHRRRLIVSAHEVPDTYLGSFIFDDVCHFVARRWLKFVYNRAHRVIAVSPYTKRELEALGVSSRIEVLCNCVDRECFRPNPAARLEVRRRLGINDEAFVVVNAAQIQPRKGFELFIDTARRAPDLEFVWVGGRPFGRLSADFGKLTRLMQQAPPNVHFPGQVLFEEMPAYYAMADACFFPSIQECFGYTIIEAAAAGLPVVLRDNPAYEDYLFDHYLASSTPDGAAKLLRRLNDDARFLREQRAHSEALAELYDLRRYTERLVELYRRVAAEAPAPGCCTREDPYELEGEPVHE